MKEDEDESLSEGVVVMPATAQTFTLDGIEARPLRVEVDVHRGLPSFSIAGLPDAAVRESRERVRAALANCGFEFPIQRIVANLAPASLRKSGPGLDLPLAVALLVASGQLEWERLPSVAMVGELALDGSLRSVPGVLPIAEAAQKSGVEAIVVPAENRAEAAVVDDLEVIALESLAQIRALAAGELVPARPEAVALPTWHSGDAPDFADLRDQPHLRRALEVAAAGEHSLLIVGPPGAGKSLVASRLPSILPPLSDSEALEVARIASVCGRLGQWRLSGRPFRAPHHTISPPALLGGGTPTAPGEVTLAHRGVLFLDELCEFSRESLEALHGPLESGWASVSRAGGNRRLPCRFLLVAASNPCPCGLGQENPECSCTPQALRRYQARLDAALGEQIDIVVAMSPPTVGEIAGPPGEPSAAVRERVIEARERQEARRGSGRCNAAMAPDELRECALTEDAAALLAEAHSRRRLGGAGHDRVLRLARTIADLGGAETIGRGEVAQALALRRRGRG